jgi:hypothetical protein
LVAGWAVRKVAESAEQKVWSKVAWSVVLSVFSWAGVKVVV